MDDAKALLNQLMGQNRDLSYKEQIKKQEHFSDDRVCKNALVSKCFNELFPKTPYDLGTCHKRHEPIFIHQFQNEETYKRYKCERRYIDDALAYMEGMVQDVDEKIKSKTTSLENKEGKVEDRPKEIQDRVEIIEEEIRVLLEQSNQLGEEGQLELSEQKSNEAEMKQKIKEDIIKQADMITLGGVKFEQAVCEICGAIQSAIENDRRRLIHQDGKIHLGFKFFREEIPRLKERRVVVKQKEEELRKSEKSKSRSRSRSHRKRSKHSSKHSKKSKKHHKSSRRHYSSSSSSSERDRKKKKHRKSRRDYSSSSSRSRSYHRRR